MFVLKLSWFTHADMLKLFRSFDLHHRRHLHGKWRGRRKWPTNYIGVWFSIRIIRPEDGEW